MNLVHVCTLPMGCVDAIELVIKIVNALVSSEQVVEYLRQSPLRSVSWGM